MCCAVRRAVPWLRHVRVLCCSITCVDDDMSCGSCVDLCMAAVDVRRADLWLLRLRHVRVLLG